MQFYCANYTTVYLNQCPEIHVQTHWFQCGFNSEEKFTFETRSHFEPLVALTPESL